ncbi:hypothetical protein ABT352_31300 [Streptosporangium sp. NPDC000563]|uniref:hypothetical protein n=1 Tax=unclassified Streptosporangium TaxID=2632669 RepID=UPI003330FD5C
MIQTMAVVPGRPTVSYRLAVRGCPVEVGRPGGVSGPVEVGRSGGVSGRGEAGRLAVPGCRAEEAW